MARKARRNEPLAPETTGSIRLGGRARCEHPAPACSPQARGGQRFQAAPQSSSGGQGDPVLHRRHHQGDSRQGSSAGPGQSVRAHEGSN
uniref:Uncharacterized protein n=1 Tax=Setaria viridis TaxID=4556 RepID=A0A4U6TCZ7_SETVI|nr:hypothetical protein SEVIR_8G035900v2 [Setaria viridis]